MTRGDDGEANGSTLRLEDHGRGAVLVLLDGPGTRNALDDHLVRQLGDAVVEAGSRGARVLAIMGAGGAFSSGGAYTSLLALLDEAEQDLDLGTRALERHVRRNSTVIERLAETPMTTVAIIDGACVGAALGLALACDLRFAAPEARVATGFARIGLGSDLGTGPLVRAVAPSIGERALASTGFLDAEELAALGFACLEGAPSERVATAIESARQLSVSGREVGRRDRFGSGSALAEALDAEAREFAARLGSREALARVRAAVASRR